MIAASAGIAPYEALAQRYERAGTHLYAVAIPLHLVSTYLPVPDPNEPMDGNRRVSPVHARGFADYWAANERWVVPPILVDTPMALARHFTPLVGTGPLVAGPLHLPGPAESGIQILDGQHRVLGWTLLWRQLAVDAESANAQMTTSLRSGGTAEFRQAFAELAAVQRLQKRMRDESVTVEILEGVDLDEHKQYFFDIAANARGISKSLSAGFDRRESFHRVAQLLAAEHPLLADRVDMENDRVGAQEHTFLSLRNVVDVATAAAVGVNGWISRSHEDLLTDESVRDIAEAALDALTGSFDDLADVAEGAITPGELRRTSLLGSVTMLRALAGAYHSIAVRNLKVTEAGDTHARTVFALLAAEMGFPVTDLWRASRAFSSRDSRAPGARRQDLTNLVTLVRRIAAETTTSIPPVPRPTPAPARAAEAEPESEPDPEPQRGPDPEPAPQPDPEPEPEPAQRLVPTQPANLPQSEAAPPSSASTSGRAWPSSWTEDDEPQPVLTTGGATADPIKDYLKQIGKFALLNAEQEVDLAKRIEVGVFAQERLDTGAFESRHERRDLERLAADGVRAKDVFLRANLRLVVSIAKRYTGRGLPFLDLIQEGNLGLIRAIEKFDHREGTKFSTYATWWVRQAISRSMADDARVIRLPVHVVEVLNKVRSTGRALAAASGMEPTHHQIADAAGLPVEQVASVLAHAHTVLSLDARMPAVGDEWRDGDWERDAYTVPLGLVTVDESAIDPAEAAVEAALSDDMNRIVLSLAKRDAAIVFQRFGLDGMGPKTLDEVGKLHGVTRERIRQLEAKALVALREPWSADVLREYADLRSATAST